MRKFVLLIAALLFLTQVNAHEKKTSIEPNSILLLAELNDIGVEKANREKQSIQLSPHILTRGSNFYKETALGLISRLGKPSNTMV